MPAQRIPAPPEPRVLELAGSPVVAQNDATETILDQIGGTPLVRLGRCVPRNGAEIWLKLENQNPSGSMKDRMALAMIEGAERDGLIEPGRTTVVEYSGGSTGPALALVCAVRGYRCRIVISDSHTEERIQLMRALGAEVEIVASVEGRPPRVSAEDIRRMAERSTELAALPDHYATLQFTNPYIVPAIRDGLGREIWEQTSGRVTAFVQGVGTAGSLIGVAQALRPHGVHICALEPTGSAAISGGVQGPFATQGWSGMVPPRWDPGCVDEVEQIGDQEAIEMTRRISREEGIFVGISTGANVVGAIRLAERLGPEAVVVTIAVDTGFKYMSVAPYGEPTYAAGLVGRDEELAAVESFLAAAAAGPQTLVLEGEPGIGKTALWEAALRGARQRSYTVLACRPAEQRAERSFGALARLLESVSVGALESLTSWQRGVLEAAVGVREPSGPPVAPRAIGLALLKVLRGVASGQPVVVAIDDAHWLDAASASAINFALHAVEAERVSFLLVRGGDGRAPFDLGGLVRLQLEPLSLGALQRLLQDRLGVVLPRPQVVRVHRVSGGNPFVALELAASGSSLPPGDEALTTSRALELLGVGLAALPDEVQDVLLELAALCDPRVGMIERGRLEPATSTGLIAVEGGRVRFRHPLLATAAYERASPARRAEVHSRLAGQFDDLEERARHLALATGGASEESASALEQAAQHAAARGASAAAAELAELALKLSPRRIDARSSGASCWPPRRSSQTVPRRTAAACSTASSPASPRAWSARGPVCCLRRLGSTTSRPRLSSLRVRSSMRATIRGSAPRSVGSSHLSGGPVETSSARSPTPRRRAPRRRRLATRGCSCGCSPCSPCSKPRRRRERPPGRSSSPWNSKARPSVQSARTRHVWSRVHDCWRLGSSTTRERRSKAISATLSSLETRSAVPSPWGSWPSSSFARAAGTWPGAMRAREWSSGTRSTFRMYERALLPCMRASAHITARSAMRGRPHAAAPVSRRTRKQVSMRLRTRQRWDSRSSPLRELKRPTATSGRSSSTALAPSVTPPTRSKR